MGRQFRNKFSIAAKNFSAKATLVKCIPCRCLLFALLGCIHFPAVLAKSGRPSLIPMPQEVHWTGGNFELRNCQSILINNASLRELAGRVQQIAGKQFPVRFNSRSTSRCICLRLGKIEAPSCPQEAYRLTVGKNEILLTANTLHGIFNGLQTFRQIILDGQIVACCTVTDWPSYAWRGYMVDVGRNYQSVKQLRQQVDIMGRYKLNVFHFHATEDIAWRIAIQRYPQLTAPNNMLRDKGKFYSPGQIKDLIAYCRERFITFVPEIDMPGHSAAFTRAFGVSVQSQQGLAILKKIITDLCKTYDIRYLHLGADEVQITNTDFIPQLANLVHGLGKQTLGWSPGGNYDHQTIRQEWRSRSPNNHGSRWIDSRNLYINHMDPLESVVSIYEREICDTTCGDATRLGGEICLWNDRRVATENDLLSMNPVYPAMLAFAERSWRGGGFPGVVVHIGGSLRAKAFREFEDRLIDHKNRFFQTLPFPYVRQSSLHWKMYGPFYNGGDVSKVFWPENGNLHMADSAATGSVTGGTIYLRHWWFPLFRSWYSEPQDSTTWYAGMNLWKSSGRTGYLWIGFNDFSRSMATDSPDSGTWDSRGSEIWLNGTRIPPPLWKNAGRRGNLETPLADEGYSYRAPVRVHYRKGWNCILVKLPVNSFNGKNWQNPVKWMFTVVPVHKGKGMNWNSDE